MDKENKEVMAIPKWFVWLVSGFIGLFVPWASWVTMSLATISVRMENQIEIRDRISLLEAKFAEHLTERGIHHHLEDDLKTIRERLNRLEKQADG